MLETPLGRLWVNTSDGLANWWFRDGESWDWI